MTQKHIKELIYEGVNDVKFFEIKMIKILLKVITINKATFVQVSEEYGGRIFGLKENKIIVFIWDSDASKVTLEYL